MPRYPNLLRQAAVEGEVLAQFVVDTDRRAEVGSLKILKSSHDLFTESVRTALPQMRFVPADRREKGRAARAGAILVLDVALIQAAALLFDNLDGSPCSRFG